MNKGILGNPGYICHSFAGFLRMVLTFYARNARGFDVLLNYTTGSKITTITQSEDNNTIECFIRKYTDSLQVNPCSYPKQNNKNR